MGTVPLSTGGAQTQAKCGNIGQSNKIFSLVKNKDGNLDWGREGQGAGENENFNGECILVTLVKLCKHITNFWEIED